MPLPCIHWHLFPRAILCPVPDDWKGRRSDQGIYRCSRYSCRTDVVPSNGTAKPSSAFDPPIMGISGILEGKWRVGGTLREKIEPEWNEPTAQPGAPGALP